MHEKIYDINIGWIRYGGYCTATISESNPVYDYLYIYKDSTCEELINQSIEKTELFKDYHITGVYKEKESSEEIPIDITVEHVRYVSLMRVNDYTPTNPYSSTTSATRAEVRVGTGKRYYSS